MRVRSSDPLLRAQAILTDRDLLLLDWLYDHRILTTPQITHALFGSDDFAQRRLTHLTRLAVLDRFRPQRWQGGSYPYHYLLDQLGHEIVAGQREDELPRRDTARRIRAHLTSRANLPHRLGVNQFFTDLAGYARTHPGHRLDWPSPAPYANPSAFIHSDNDNVSVALLIRAPRPDGWGTWHQHGHSISFFVEWDNATEVLDILTDKILSYHRVASYVTWRWPILFVLPTLRRERNLLSHLRAKDIAVATPIATTALDLLATTGRSPAENVWHLYGHDGPRLPLVRLPRTDHAFGGFEPATAVTAPSPADEDGDHQSRPR